METAGCVVFVIFKGRDEMRKILAYILLIFTACTAMAQVYRVGDVYTAPDGSQGIVFHLHPDGSGGWVVALNDASAGCPWGTEDDVPGLVNSSTVYSNVSYLFQQMLCETAGYENTRVLREFQNNNPAYAAGMVDFEHGWYLPAPGQLSKLYSQMPFISSAILEAGGTLLSSGLYWTTAEYSTIVWCVHFGHGQFDRANKRNNCRVRAIRSFTYESSYEWSTGSTEAVITVSPEQTTEYSVTVTAPTGCTGVEQHTIVVNMPDSVEVAKTVCDSYEWNGQTYSESGDYMQTLVNQYGCDSVVTLHLTVNPAVAEHVEATACESYAWNGVTYTESGDYTQTFNAANGCDSVVTLHLTINPAVAELVETTACESYDWNGVTYTASGDYTQTFNAANGCDSVVTLHLTVNPAVAEHVEATACESYVWNGVTYTESGDYTQTFTNQYGCDSVVTLHLTINPAVAEHVEATACESYEWNGVTYTESGVYTQTFTSQYGCDSVVTLHLEFVSVSPDNIADVDCIMDAEQQPWDAQVMLSTNDIHCYYVPLAGDIDGDGIVEIVAGKTVTNDHYTSQVGIYRGTDLQEISTISVPQRIFAGYVGPMALVRYPDGNGGWQGAVVLHCWDGKLRSYDVNGQLLSESDVNTPCGGAISVADFNLDGWPEIYIGNAVYDAATLRRLCAGPANGHMGLSWRSGSSMTNGCSMSFAADLLGDVHPELICGNSIYRVDIVSRTDISLNSVSLAKTIPLPAHLPQDGNVAVADFNLDGRLDVLVTVDATPETVMDTAYFYAYDPVTEEILFIHRQFANSVGYPFVGDINGDNLLEFVYLDYQPQVANSRITAMHYDPVAGLQTLWRATHADESGETSMTLFDFNQDNIMEIVYRDQARLRIINGSGRSHLTGNDTLPFYDLYSLNMTAGTWTEYPVVADVNSDGRAEIVTCGRMSTGLGWVGGQLVVVGGIHPWAPARKVWNQYMYNVTNINEDLTVPAPLFNNATAFTDPDNVVRRPYNNFLQQATTIDPYGRPFSAVPDIAVEESSIQQFSENDSIAISFSFCNNGDNALYAPYPVAVFANENGGDTICTALMEENLLVDSCTTGEIRLPASVLCGREDLDHLVVVVNCAGSGIAQNGGLQPECDTANNMAELPVRFHTDTIHLTDTACEHYLWYGDTLTLSGEYTRIFTNTMGCDSVISLHLTIHIPQHQSETVVADESYVWNGETYTESGDYLFAHPDENGCDEVDTLHLTVYYSSFSEIEAVVCDSYTWNDSVYTTSGTYVQTFTNSHGTDSVVTLHLTVHYSAVADEETSVCESDFPYRWNGVTFDEGGTQTVLLQTVHGCDSLVTMTVYGIGEDLDIVMLTEDFCEDFSADLLAQTAMTNFMWSTGETTPQITVTHSGTYYVTASEGNCIVTDKIFIPVCEFQLYLPNAITASDNNGINDYFYIPQYSQRQINDFEIVIYNRWGQMVFRSEDKNFRWHGDSNGKIMTNTTYTYVIYCTNYNGKEFIFKGIVTVL